MAKEYEFTIRAGTLDDDEMQRLIAEIGEVLQSWNSRQDNAVSEWMAEADSDAIPF